MKFLFKSFDFLLYFFFRMIYLICKYYPLVILVLICLYWLSLFTLLCEDHGNSENLYYNSNNPSYSGQNPVLDDNDSDSGIDSPRISSPWFRQDYPSRNWSDKGKYQFCFYRAKQWEERALEYNSKVNVLRRCKLVLEYDGMDFDVMDQCILFNITGKSHMFVNKEEISNYLTYYLSCENTALCLAKKYWISTSKYLYRNPNIVRYLPEGRSSQHPLLDRYREIGG